jgi:SAM-dependent methyltransferase
LDEPSSRAGRQTGFFSGVTNILHPNKIAHAAGTGASIAVESCQICGHTPLDNVLSLGYMPPPNRLTPVGEPPKQQSWYPTDFLYCKNCGLAQLGLVIDPAVVFPPEFPYTTGNTKALRDNFAELYRESSALLDLKQHDLIIDVGSNDGTLLANFKAQGHRVLGIEPTDVGDIANKRNILTLKRYFNLDVAREVKREHGPASVIAATNCFAHIEGVRGIMEAIVELLKPGGVFISESHYLMSLLDGLQYDTIYHEHLRYYSIASLKYLFQMHDMELFHVRPIPTHGGSIRVYAAKRGARPIEQSVGRMLAAEPSGKVMAEKLAAFKREVVLSKLRLLSMLHDLKEKGARIAAIGAAARATTLLHYVGLDEGIIDYVCEVAGSLKIGQCMPGTQIPVVDEARLFTDQPHCALLFSWHLADQLAPMLKAKEFHGRLIAPLPVPRML